MLNKWKKNCRFQMGWAHYLGWPNWYCMGATTNQQNSKRQKGKGKGRWFYQRSSPMDQKITHGRRRALRVRSMELDVILFLIHVFFSKFPRVLILRVITKDHHGTTHTSSVMSWLIELCLCWSIDRCNSNAIKENE